MKPAIFPLHDRLAGVSRPARHLLGLIETVGSVGKVIEGLKVAAMPARCSTP